MCGWGGLDYLYMYMYVYVCFVSICECVAVCGYDFCGRVRVILWAKVGSVWMQFRG